MGTELYEFGKTCKYLWLFLSSQSLKSGKGQFFFLGVIVTTHIRLTTFNFQHKVNISRIVRIVHVSRLQPLNISVLWPTSRHGGCCCATSVQRVYKPLSVKPQLYLFQTLECVWWVNSIRKSWVSHSSHKSITPKD